jgi:hypothetical protein
MTSLSQFQAAASSILPFSFSSLKLSCLTSSLASGSFPGSEPASGSVLYHQILRTLPSSTRSCTQTQLNVQLYRSKNIAGETNPDRIRERLASAVHDDAKDDDSDDHDIDEPLAQPPHHHRHRRSRHRRSHRDFRDFFHGGGDGDDILEDEEFTHFMDALFGQDDDNDRDHDENHRVFKSRSRSQSHSSSMSIRPGGPPGPGVETDAAVGEAVDPCQYWTITQQICQADSKTGVDECNDIEKYIRQCPDRDPEQYDLVKERWYESPDAALEFGASSFRAPRVRVPFIQTDIFEEFNRMADQVEHARRVMDRYDRHIAKRRHRRQAQWDRDKESNGHSVDPADEQDI